MCPQNDQHATGQGARSISTAVALAALTLSGLALRLISLNARGLWLDEATTVRQSSLSLPGIVVELADGVHPPLFHLIMHFWMLAFGRGEVAIRSFSVLTGTIAIPVAYWAGRRLYDRRTALISSGLVALLPFLVWYSQEARMYSLVFLAGLISTTCLALAIDRNQPMYWVGYFVSTLAGMFSHYLFLFLVMGQVVFYLFGEVVSRERSLRTSGAALATLRRPWGLLTDVPTLAAWLLTTVGAGFLLLIWLMNSVFLKVMSNQPLLASIGGAGLGYGEAARLALRFNDTAQVFVELYAGFHSRSAMETLVAMWPLLIYLVFLVMHLIRPVSRRTWVLLASASGILVMVIVGQWQHQLFLSRYFIGVGAPALLLVARLLAKLNPRAAAPLLAGLAILSTVAWADQSYNPRNVMLYDNRQAFSKINSGWRPGDAVLYEPHYVDALANYYLARPSEAYGLPAYGNAGELRNASGQIDEDTARAVGSSPRVWLFLSFQNIPEVSSEGWAVRDWLKRHGYEVKFDRRMNQVELLRYEIGPEPLEPPEPFLLPDRGTDSTQGSAVPSASMAATASSTTTGTTR